MSAACTLSGCVSMSMTFSHAARSRKRAIGQADGTD